MQKEVAIRTYKKKYPDLLNKYLKLGYIVKIATKCEEYIEYILQKEIQNENLDSKS
jgi:uncharacterized membrane protein